MPAYGMVGTLFTAPDNRPALLAILTQAAELMQDVAGCRLYVVSQELSDASAVWIMELWDSQEAHDESLKLPRVRELIGQAMPLLTRSPQGASLLPVSGKGL